MSEDQDQDQDSDQWDDNTADSKQPEEIIDLGAGVVLQNPETVTVIATPDIHDKGPPLDLAATDQYQHQDQDPDQWDNDKAGSEQPAMLVTPEKEAATPKIHEKGPPYDLAATDSEQPAMLVTPEKVAATPKIHEKGPPYDLAATDRDRDPDQWDNDKADSEQPAMLATPEKVAATPKIHEKGPLYDLAATDRDRDPDQWDNDKADSEQPAMLATPEKVAASQDIHEKGPPYDLSVSTSTLIRFPRKKPWMYILVILVVVIVGGVVAYIFAFPSGEKSNTSSSTLSPPGSEGNDSSPAAPANSITAAPTYSMSSSPSIVTPFPSASPSIRAPSTSSAPTRPDTMGEIVFAQVLGKCAAGFPDVCSDDEFVAMKWFYDMSNHPEDVALDEQRMAVSFDNDLRKNHIKNTI